MKEFRLYAMMFTAVILLAVGNVCGQTGNAVAGQKPGSLLEPQKKATAEAQAKEWTKQGWKAEQYTVESQLSYTNALKCEADSVTGEPAYLWVQQEVKASTLRDAQMRASKMCMESITRQYTVLMLSRFNEVLAQKGATEAQKSFVESKLTEAITRVVKIQASKSLELSKEKDGQVSVRMVMVLDKAKAKNMIRGSFMSVIKDDKDAELYKKVLQEALSTRPRPHKQQ